MEILPSGLSFVEKTSEPIPVQICKASPDGPWFTVYVNRLSVGRFRDLVSKNNAPSGIRSGSKAAKEYQAKFEEAYCKAVIADWDGLTINNFEFLLPDRKIGGEAAEDFRREGKEMAFSVDLAAMLYRETWSDQFGDRIFAVLKEGVDEDEAERQEKKDS